MERGYYEDYDDFIVERTVDNLIGYGVDVDNPLDRIGNIKFNTGHERLKQCMVDILETPEGSRFFNPIYGSKLYKLIEEPNDFVAEDIAELYAREAIEKWEPRVIVDNVVAQVDPDDKNTILIRIDYRMKDTNDADSFVYSFNRKIPEMEG